MMVNMNKTIKIIFKNNKSKINSKSKNKKMMKIYIVKILNKALIFKPKLLSLLPCLLLVNNTELRNNRTGKATFTSSK